ncbi:MAG TPA: glutamate--tRNA ligase family protein [Candidatus Limnocylindria bacterium]|nr:glutamate--tRNA ligase family protein [Candidatus Limnocylindria bacterium]
MNLPESRVARAPDAQSVVAPAVASEPASTSRPTTRFAPAPTGRLHLGHLANAIYVWGLARRFGGWVLLRIEDHDRQRCRPEYEAALLDDLDRLGLAADAPSTEDLRAGPSIYRQSDNGSAYAAALETLRSAGRAYACDCTRSTFAAWMTSHGMPWIGTGCPGGCRARELEDGPGLGVRAVVGDRDEAWTDLLLGEQRDPVSPAGDLLIRDRHGNWSYALCVVVDDLRHGVDLVVRGEDLLESTPPQLRLARILGRSEPPRFAHHPLVRRHDGSKLSKADGATAVGDMLDAGAPPAELFGRAARMAGLAVPAGPLELDAALELVASRISR